MTHGENARISSMFTVPDLHPGTLDSLLALSDDLVKSNIFIEGVSQKIRRQIEDLERAGGVEPGTLTVDGVPVDSYLTRFVWDKGKYPVNAPLKETVASIQSQVNVLCFLNMYILSSSLMWLPPRHTSLQGPRVGMIFYKFSVMCVVKRDGQTETVHFDKITMRLKKLSYGLNQEHCDPVLVAQKLAARIAVSNRPPSGNSLCGARK
ncbi:uncharacterized protein [Aegilops tauschii subsp. strangulata]